MSLKININTWIPCTDYNELPLGAWIVKIDKDRKPYNIAVVSENDRKQRIVIVGNHFSWDMGNLIAYSGFEPYE
jgi:hypothetical protein